MSVNVEKGGRWGGKAIFHSLDLTLDLNWIQMSGS